MDAVPILGTGTILVPWALVCLIQGEQLSAIGLLVIYGITFVTRTALEPKIIGRTLNLDPLLTLIFLYVGFRFWGFLGLILTPILGSALISALRIEKPSPGGKVPPKGADEGWRAVCLRRVSFLRRQERYKRTGLGGAMGALPVAGEAT